MYTDASILTRQFLPKFMRREEFSRGEVLSCADEGAFLRKRHIHFSHITDAQMKKLVVFFARDKDEFAAFREFSRDGECGHIVIVALFY